jgi:hypothetical protein
MLVLLFVFWYCHKRGKEVRLEKERELTEQEVAQLDREFRAAHPGEVLTTTAEPGASVEEVRAGFAEAKAAKQAAAETGTTPTTDKTPAAEPEVTADVPKTS